MTFTVNYEILGGTPNYTVTLSNGINNFVNVHNSDGTYSFTGVTTGTYILRAEDSIQCILEEQVFVNVAPPDDTTTTLPVCTIDFTNVSVNRSGGSLPFTFDLDFIYTITGGVPPFQVSVDTSDGQNILAENKLLQNTPLTSSTENVASNITNGVLTVRDETGCIQTYYLDWNFVTPDFKIVINSVSSDSENGDGTQLDPYDSNTDLSFAVNGNGGVATSGDSFPFIFELEVVTDGNSNLAVRYKDVNYISGQTIALLPPQNRIEFENDGDEFIGGVGTGNTQNSVKLINAINGVGDIRPITINAKRNGVVEDSITIYVQSGGSLT
jgi:hypothetical protein